MQLKVKFEYHYFGRQGYLYTCHIISGSITQRNTKITSITGSHDENKSNANVKVVLIENSIIEFFPRGVSDFFPKVLVVSIRQYGLTAISRKDLIGLDNIDTLDLDYNKLTSLPDDLFADMKKLKIISFASNQLHFMSSNLLQPIMNNELVCVDFRKNPNIDALFKPGHPESVLLNKLMKMIDRKCQKLIEIEPIEDNQSPTSTQEPMECAQITPFEAEAQSFDTPITDFHEVIKENLSSGSREMWNSGSFSDLTIIASTKEFKVHKCILSIHSPTFAAIFKQNPEVSEIKINEFRFEAVEIFLKSLYIGDVTEEEDSAMEIYALAAHYGIEELKSKFEEIIYKSIDQSNAYQIFELSHRHKSEKLKQKAFVELKKLLPFKEFDDEMIDDLTGVKTLYEGTQSLLEFVRGRKRKFPE